MEHERLGVGVVEQVPELLVEVPVVHVHRHAAHLERAVLRLEVLVAVVEEQRDLGVVTEPGRDVRGGEASGALVVLGPGASCRPVDECDLVGDLVGDRLPDRGVVRLHRRAA